MTILYTYFIVKTTEVVRRKTGLGVDQIDSPISCEFQINLKV